MRTDNRMQTHWEETRLFIKKVWPKFTDGDLDQVNGHFDRFLEYLKDFYGNFPLNEAIARDKLKLFYNKLDQVIHV